ncbi:MAG: M48 family metallopeptidase [Lachnospiraceae bacterium]|nr:M48 family metallopeptidase [Lachnospiraceae bacterium]
MTEQILEYKGVAVYLTRKKIKNLYIRIKEPDARVMVSVPLRTSRKAIAAFLEGHWSWICEKRSEILENQKPPEPEKQYLSGERHLLWGIPYELITERSLKKPLTELRENAIYMRVTAHSTKVERKKQLDSWYRQRLEERLAELIPTCEEIVGKHALEWRFRRMKTRWGTCNIQKKRICLNIQLAEKPPECLEYVVIHELTHLHEPGHNKRFWGLMDVFCTDWREKKRKLNGD